MTLQPHQQNSQKDEDRDDQLLKSFEVGYRAGVTAAVRAIEKGRAQRCSIGGDADASSNGIISNDLRHTTHAQSTGSGPVRF